MLHLIWIVFNTVCQRGQTLRFLWQGKPISREVAKWRIAILPSESHFGLYNLFNFAFWKAWKQFVRFFKRETHFYDRLRSGKNGFLTTNLSQIETPVIFLLLLSHRTHAICSLALADLFWPIIHVKESCHIIDLIVLENHPQASSKSVPC